MLEHGEWELVICNDPDDDFNLTAEITRNGEILAFIRRKAGKPTVTWFKSGEDIDIPFDWFSQAVQEAGRRLSASYLIE